MTPQASGYLPHRQIKIVMLGLITGMFLAALDQSIVGTALPTITSDLGGLDKLSWVVTSYLLTSTASTPLWGKVSDNLGRRPMFQAAIAVFLVGSVLAGFSSSMEQLIAFRAVQGIGGGGLMALALATIGDIVPPRERPRYQGYIAGTFASSSVLGPVLGGFFADGPGWEWIFFINVPLGLIALAVTTAALRIDHVTHHSPVDWAGATVLVASVSSLLLFTSWAGPEEGWASPLALGLLVAGLALVVGFIAVENQVVDPILPMRLFSNKIFSTANAFGFLMGATMFGVLVFMPVYLQLVKGFSPTASGLALLPMIAGLFTAITIVGRRLARTGSYKIYPPIGAGLALMSVVLLTQLAAQTPYTFIAVALFVMGAGLGATMQVITIVVQNAVDRREMGVATSSVAFFRSMGGAFGTAVFGAVLTVRLDSGLKDLGGALPGGIEAGTLTSNMSLINALPPTARTQVLETFSQALNQTFLVAVPVLLVAICVGLTVPEKLLATRDAAASADPDNPELLAGGGSSAAL